MCVGGVFIKSTCLSPLTRVQSSGVSLAWELSILSVAFEILSLCNSSS